MRADPDVIDEVKNGRGEDAADPAGRVPRIPFRGHYTPELCAARLAWLRQETGAGLEELGTYRLDPQTLKGNIEHFIGMAGIPVGVAGPLLLEGQHVTGYVYAPFATTEGTLVASATRGALAVSASGGARTRVVHQQMMRAPAFFVDTGDDALRLQDWIEAHRSELEAEVRQASNYAELIALDPIVTGNILHVRFLYRTGDAAGQNMTTACTWRACQWILQHLTGVAVRHFVVEANLSGDKKVCALNFEQGRGTRVVAEAVLSEEILRSVLKVSTETLLETYRGFVAGSVQAGMLGFNVNVANTIAALFTATGQDIACVHESSVGQLELTPAEGGVRAALTLPSLIVGTVGGGTGLPTQRECLEMMGCYGPGRAQRLAEIVAGFCLALDLSTLSAIAGGQFAIAHEKLGRNRPQDGLKDEHLTPAFFEEVLHSRNRQARSLTVTSFAPFDIDTSASILSDLSAQRLNYKKVGHLPYHVVFREDGAERAAKLVLKAKPTDIEVVGGLNQMAQACGGATALHHEAHKFDTGFRHCHIRELAVCAEQDPRFTAITPAVYHCWRDDRREIFVLAMEYLEGVSHLNTENDVGAWRPEHIEGVLRDLASFHSLYLDRTDRLEAADWMDVQTAERIDRMRPLWHALAGHHAREFPQMYTAERVDRMGRIIDRLPAIWETLEQAPRTLIHNDFNPRNLCLRPTPEGYRLCAYDWELATVHVPQHDVAEFLAFVLPPGTPPAERLRYVEVYRRALEGAAGRSFAPGPFAEIFDLTCLDLLVNRMSLYAMVHTFKVYPFLPRVLEGLFAYTASLEA